MSEEEEKYNKIPTFGGDKAKYDVFKIRFKAWEKYKKVASASSRDRTAELPTEEDYDLGTTVPDPAVLDNNGDPVRRNLTDAEKKLYEDNATSLGKLTRSVSDELLVALMVAGGPKQSVWLIKQWLETNYAEVVAADSLQDLQKKLTELHPSDFEQSMFYLAKLEDLNTRLGKVGANYQLDDLQLKLEVLNKLPDITDKRPYEKWSQFQGRYRENGAQTTTWLEFKQHLTKEWKNIGAPTNGGGGKAGKALNVEVPGSKFFPFVCNHCKEKAGHKAADCPKKHIPRSVLMKQKKTGKGKKNGGGGNTEKKKETRACFNCKKEDHLIADCPNLKAKKDKAEKVEIALAIKEVKEELGVAENSAMVSQPCGHCLPRKKCHHADGICSKTQEQKGLQRTVHKIEKSVTNHYLVESGSGQVASITGAQDDAPDAQRSCGSIHDSSEFPRICTVNTEETYVFVDVADGFESQGGA